MISHSDTGTEEVCEHFVRTVQCGIYLQSAYMCIKGRVEVVIYKTILMLIGWTREPRSRQQEHVPCLRVQGVGVYRVCTVQRVHTGVYSRIRVQWREGRGGGSM